MFIHVNEIGISQKIGTDLTQKMKINLTTNRGNELDLEGEATQKP